VRKTIREKTVGVASRKGFSEWAKRGREKSDANDVGDDRRYQGEGVAVAGEKSSEGGCREPPHHLRLDFSVEIAGPESGESEKESPEREGSQGRTGTE